MGGASSSRLLLEEELAGVRAHLAAATTQHEANMAAANQRAKLQMVC